MKELPLNVLDHYAVTPRPIHSEQPVLLKQSCEMVLKLLEDIIPPQKELGQSAIHTRMIVENLPEPEDVSIKGVLLEGNHTVPGDHVDPSKVTQEDLEEAERQGKMFVPDKDSNVVHWFAAKLTRCKVCVVSRTRCYFIIHMPESNVQCTAINFKLFIK